MKLLRIILCICSVVFLVVVAHPVWAQSQATGSIPTGTVAVHCIGRFIVDSSGNGQLVGYFPFIANLATDFFSGTPGESTAYFTFRSTPFQLQLLPNGNLLHILTVPAAGAKTNRVTVYYNENPNQDFSNPDSFSAGKVIAQFDTEKFMGTVADTGAVEGGTLVLTSSSPFAIQGQTYDLANLLTAVTITFSTGATLPSLFTGGPTALPFGGYGLATVSATTGGYASATRPLKGK